jgi:hypothetical protein
VLNPISQSKLQRLVASQFPDVSSRVPSPTGQFHLTLQGYFLHTDADADPPCTLTCGASRTPRRLLHAHLDRVELPSAGFVVAVAHADKLIAILLKQFFVPIWPGGKVTWARTV